MTQNPLDFEYRVGFIFCLLAGANLLVYPDLLIYLGLVKKQAILLQIDIFLTT